ncbi:hypothetical protein BAUCODRAFT_28353 [Baudoinia panamericana UAMH 10762]|uniref:Mnd1 HTH domain-containing protein n=1 Tax=Baudoinia panamericana (strain UAMH 10762) TaxID=717646 RepID=M2MIW4_BAUPA|nr:uncharacterized protein BAUCODRAFT_28353 [Baudoinia panamericana UAMH 10762]EMC91213.1 hypothetical protein BAUCODRAFT_28353 [Baudoinia panamericana UAMH 10762]
MVPKVNCNPVKLASIVTYFQKSRVAHSLKDLEKQLPSVASINGMQVKDYIQALQDDNKINVEKIGSGNWYWSFPSQDKKIREKALDDARSAYDKANAINEDLKIKLAESQAQREDEQDMLDSGGERRETLVATKTGLEAEVKRLQMELSAYSDSDPTELERKAKDLNGFKAVVGQCTDDIYSMEGWFKSIGQSEAVQALRVQLYGDELDAEEGMLREL